MMLSAIFIFSFFFNKDISADRVQQLRHYIDSAGIKSEFAVLIDMSIPSNEKRLFLVELATSKILYSTCVAHGKGSGTGTKAEFFSDVPGSLCTTLGHYLLGKKYLGDHGETYKLIGLDSSNANAMERSIVMHSAWYAEEKFIVENGRCGNSWGCPAVSEEALKTLAPYLIQNTVLWIYN